MYNRNIILYVATVSPADDDYLNIKIVGFIVDLKFI